ncbi:hypothetical protein FGIG_05107 [Fasciola gigantica]|uniref:Profilin n=1 Tax=Fasciola gigantica TaxID=46835 RepID=A0A504YKV2_FASGI|nr:hypothetical protein FGIG_05107 [Fasciola gigantica]
MDPTRSYCPWDSRCKSLLELHPGLGALCVCDHSNIILGSAFTNPEFEGISHQNEYAARPLLLLVGSATAGKTNVTFLGDRFLVVETANQCFEAKSGKKSLFLRQTNALYLIGLSTENNGIKQHKSARREMNSIQEYFESADF